MPNGCHSYVMEKRANRSQILWMISRSFLRKDTSSAIPRFLSADFIRFFRKASFLAEVVAFLAFPMTIKYIWHNLLCV